MQSEILKVLDSVSEHLSQSKISYQALSEFCSSLNQDLFLLETVFEDPLSSITRTMVDSWLCEIEFQLEKNHEYRSLNSKLQLMIENDISAFELNQSFSPISKLFASISDSKGRDQSGRPICGLLPKPFTQKLNDKFLSNSISSTNQPNNWEEWTARLENFLAVIEEIIQFFPPSHHFASLPCTTAILIRRMCNLTLEQHQLSKALEVLTINDKRGANFHLDVLMIKQKLHPSPKLIGDE